MLRHAQGRGLRLRSLGLLARFAAVSAVVFVVLGIGLAHLFSRQIREHALQEATQSAVLIARLGIQPRVTPAELRNGFEPKGAAELDHALAGGVIGAQVARIKIWNPDGRIVYSDDRNVMGKKFPIAHDLEEALEGEIESELSELKETENVSERNYAKLLEVYVPLRFTPGGKPEGVFEIYLPYAPIAAAIAEDTRMMALLLFGALALLYASLFRLVAGASRRLRRQAEDSRHQALHDALTGLPNRELFRDRVEQSIRDARRGNVGSAVLLMDLDRFKEVNDTLGHHCGDRLLVELAERLRDALRESDTLARLGGDEFAILLPNLPAPDAVVGAVERVTVALEQPFVLEGLPVAVEASIGIARYPDHGTDVDILLQRADVAMYVAKESHATYAVYDMTRDDYSPSRLTLIGELRRAMEERELVLHYQPKVDLRSGVATGAEALVRWQHPERGLLPPSEFIPFAQHTGLITPLTEYVLDAALRQCREWRDLGTPLGVAVNLSTRSLLDLTFPERVAELIDKWELDASSLELEITETMIMHDPVRALDVLSRLSQRGVRIAIDDFGTGYSSLAYLTSLPVDEIKIDRSFVTDMRQSDAIVQSTIDLGRNLGLTVVAEGVETEEACAKLRALGCGEAQGFYLSRPLPPDAFVGWLREWNTEPAVSWAGLQAAAVVPS
ncbi:MAG TPA: EAL domain-containing protein [Gaiellaceae bacterium]|nr:EAL domain-containing protein [Gaiellaceae bacterium]